jgi:hypothetical protein
MISAALAFLLGLGGSVSSGGYSEDGFVIVFTDAYASKVCPVIFPRCISIRDKPVYKNGTFPTTDVMLVSENPHNINRIGVILQSFRHVAIGCLFKVTRRQICSKFIINSNKSSDAQLDVYRRNFTKVLKINGGLSYIITFSKSDFFVGNVNIWSQLHRRCLARQTQSIGGSFRACFSVPSGLLCPMGGTRSEEQGETTNGKASEAEPKGTLCPDGGRRRPIGCFPLGTQIAVTLVLSSLAAAIWSLSLWQLFEGRRNTFQVTLAGALACGLIALSALFWW